ncbi:uncharacterized protein [Nicotiana tomentosiformis]|uniref:uncharacterized protein n=1 Tax=Nicotiana tomentosiformis TaxID=4098 RepID=UPI00388C357F
MRRQFERLRQGDMSVTQYEIRLSELACHTIWLVPMDSKRIMRFIDGLTYQLQLLMTTERVSGATFDEVVDIARQIEMVRGQERIEREAKRPLGQGVFNGASFGGQFQHGRGRNFRKAQSARPFHRGASSSQGSHSSHQCPRRHGGLSQQRSQPPTTAPVTSPPVQSTRGGGQSTRGRPRREGRSGAGQARFYALPARPDAITSDVVITAFKLLKKIMSDASGSRKLTMDELMQKWESLKSDWNSTVPMANLMQKWEQLKADWERIRPQIFADESFQNRLNFERSCEGYSTSVDYAKLKNSLKSLPYLMGRVIIEQNQLCDQFNKLKFDLMRLCGLLPEYPIIISNSDDDEIYREIEEYYSDDGDDT